MKIYLVFLALIVLMAACGSDEKERAIDEDELGFIDADVESEETNLKAKAAYRDNIPGTGDKFDRPFENAPPMIPHTTEGFLPIKTTNNICFSCHLPENAEKTNAVPVPETHFTRLRPELIKKGDTYQMEEDGKLTVNKTTDFNNAYFNCTQCHAPQTNVQVDIRNLFTPEFRKEFGLEKSDLIDKISEGVEK